VARYAIVGGAVALVVSIVALGVHFRGVIPDGPCRLTSVDEAEFVAGNRAILDVLPVYPGSTRRSSMSHGWFASDACLSFENSGPIDRYQTTDSFTLPPEGLAIGSAPWTGLDGFGNPAGPAQVADVILYYDRELSARGWLRSSWTNWEVTYRKGEALVAVSAQSNAGDPYARDPYYKLGVVHDMK
jgi:hypothetical protein